ncbi:2' O-ribose methyltransferase [Coniosporium tulheliwenetii]|uniref:2' O-ribose methyltransferase n=1 Tax=Coniosporium tulheliwenetii TaxID=3383036 RepID=A0ACC2ZN57_9PEZI|nr:2' O-ribose methyltransferase [Cladosporium sp. JES 115]
MLSRRIFRQLTDSLLLGRTLLVPCQCHVSTVARHAQSANTQYNPPQIRTASSSTRWKTRQSRDHFAREAKVAGLKSRAAFKLLEMDEKYKLFRPGNTVVDLGYAPGSWSQVAVTRTKPGGRVIGIDILPVQPPRGVSTIQGDFLSPAVQAEVRAYVQDPMRGRPRKKVVFAREEDEEVGLTEEELEEAERGCIDMERHALLGSEGRSKWPGVDVVMSDMSAPWDQTTGFWKRSVSDPYLRMMNTSGIAFRDHVGSMDLCNAALNFSFDTLRTGGHFLCKFYQGAEDKALEKTLKKLFEKVHREKPESSRSESKEAYFVALRRKEDPLKEEVFEEQT